MESSPGHRVAPLLRLLLILCLLPAGCGYHFAGTGGEPPGGINSIAVEVFGNRTSEPGIETVFTNSILNEFIRSKRLEVKARDQADAVLTGRITGIRTEDVSHLRAEITLETRVTVTMALTLRRRNTGEILWQNPSLSYYQEYEEGGNPLTTRQNRQRALREIADFLAEKVYSGILEGF